MNECECTTRVLPEQYVTRTDIKSLLSVAATNRPHAIFGESRGNKRKASHGTHIGRRTILALDT